MQPSRKRPAHRIPASTWLIPAMLCLVGCATAPKATYVAISEGLPTAGQWKANPAFGDVNADGLPDLGAIPRKGKGAYVWLNRGNGTWEDSSDGLRTNSSCGGGIEFADLNGDGLLDLALAEHCKGIFVFYGDGQGRWSPAPDPVSPMQADDLALGDLDGDGHLDLCGCSSLDQGMEIWFGDGAGNWVKGEKTGLPAVGSCHEIVLRDFDMDGALDIATGLTTGPAVWLNTGARQWSEASEGLPRSKWGGQYWGVASEDFNEDGFADLAFGRMTGGPEVFLRDVDGAWHPSTNGLAALRSGWGIAAGDVDGDGHADLVCSGTMTPGKLGPTYGIFLFRGDGKGNWRMVKDSGLPGAGLYQSWGVQLHDLDGDGIPEVAACFGTSQGQMPSFLLRTFQGEGVKQQAAWGPGGSVRIWKRVPAR